MQLSIERLTQQLPSYLSEDRIKGVKRGLDEFPNVSFWYLNAYEDEVLQGDCWTGLTALNFENGARKKIRGVVISNSCSIDPANDSSMPQQLMFVPLLRIDTLAAFFHRCGYSEDRIVTMLAAARRQEIDRFVYYPASEKVGSECVAWLDQVHTMPAEAFHGAEEKKKLATLSDTTFYLFAFKLSIYFCRLHENVDRSEAVQK